MRLLLVGLLLTCLVHAGTAVIEIKTEGSGEIVDTVSGARNLNGSMVWNGTQWVVNNTWAHKFFVDTSDGSRLKTPTITTFQGNQPGTFTSGNYAITRSLYSYAKVSATGAYRFNAVEYRIRDQITGKLVVLRSRGTGTGNSSATFDIYIEDDVTGGGVQITAFRGDPTWFTYAMNMDQALLQTSTTAGRTGTFSGSLNGAPEHYFLDQGGGGDLGPAGVGKSFIFHAATLVLQDFVLGLGTSFATDFAMRWMDTSANLHELQFLPYAEGTFTPNTPNLPSISGVISAGAFGAFPAIAPGSWIEIYGTNLASTSRAWAGADFNGVKAPTSLSGTKVSIGGQDGALSYISPGQVNAQVPANVATGQRPITVTTAVGTSPSYNITVNARQPGLFAHPSFIIGGKQHIGAVYSNDGNTFVMPTGAVPGITSRPAKPGDAILLFGIGFGAVTPGPWAGEIAQQQSALVEPVTMRLSQSLATLGYAGLVPGAVGLYQFNMVVPTVAAADAVPLTFVQGGVAGTQTLYMAVGK